MNFLLLKSDWKVFIVHRESWARYFRSVGLSVAFWSAQHENERLLGVSYKLSLVFMICYFVALTVQALNGETGVWST